MLRWRAWFAALAAFFCVATARAADLLIVMGGEGASYQELADSLARELGRNGTPPDLRTVSAREFAREPVAARVTVAVGTLAANAVSSRRLQSIVISALLPRSAFERIAEEQGRRVDGRYSAVYLDQPPARQFDLLRLAVPERPRVAVLAGPDSEADLPALAQLAAARRMKLASQTARAERDIYPALQRLLPEADVLLALPDPLVFNSNTAHNILLASYRSQVPVAGFSASYVKAGALLAVYSTPAQIGLQVADMVRRALASGAAPPPQYPREFLVSVNAHVARSLGIAVDDEAALRERLIRLERQ